MFSRRFRVCKALRKGAGRGFRAECGTKAAGWEPPWRVQSGREAGRLQPGRGEGGGGRASSGEPGCTGPTDHGAAWVFTRVRCPPQETVAARGGRCRARDHGQVPERACWGRTGWGAARLT